MACAANHTNMQPAFINYSLFTLRRARSSLRINGEWALLRVNRLYACIGLPGPLLNYIRGLLVSLSFHLKHFYWVGNFRVSPWFRPTAVGWNLGLRGTFLAPTFQANPSLTRRPVYIDLSKSTHSTQYHANDDCHWPSLETTPIYFLAGPPSCI